MDLFAIDVVDAKNLHMLKRNGRKIHQGLRNVDTTSASDSPLP